MRLWCFHHVGFSYYSSIRILRFCFYKLGFYYIFLACVMPPNLGWMKIDIYWEKYLNLIQLRCQELVCNLQGYEVQKLSQTLIPSPNPFENFNSHPIIHKVSHRKTLDLPLYITRFTSLRSTMVETSIALLQYMFHSHLRFSFTRWILFIVNPKPNCQSQILLLSSKLKSIQIQIWTQNISFWCSDQPLLLPAPNTQSNAYNSVSSQHPTHRHKTLQLSRTEIKKGKGKK